MTTEGDISTFDSRAIYNELAQACLLSLLEAVKTGDNDAIKFAFTHWGEVNGLVAGLENQNKPLVRGVI